MEFTLFNRIRSALQIELGHGTYEFTGILYVCAAMPGARERHTHQPQSLGGECNLIEAQFMLDVSDDLCFTYPHMYVYCYLQTFQRIRNNRQNRLRIKGRKRKYGNDLYFMENLFCNSCPICKRKYAIEAGKMPPEVSWGIGLNWYFG